MQFSELLSIAPVMRALEVGSDAYLWACHIAAR